MIKKSLNAFFLELNSYTKSEKLFILLVMLCSFCITGEFSTTKPVSCSLFLSHFSSTYLPLAWIALLPINFLAVSIYNRYLAKLGCFKIAALSVGFTILVNTTGAFVLKTSPWFSFIHFIWKDIYVLLMFQHLWSVVHATIEKKKAKYLYGVIYGIGGLGSVCGSCIPGFLARKLGSEKLLFVTLFFYLFFLLFYFLSLKTRNAMEKEKTLAPIQFDKKQNHDGFKLIIDSPHLKFILMIVVLMQLASTLMDFQFNTYLQDLIREKDLRTEYAARLFAIVHALNMIFQFIGAFLLLEVIGLKSSHFLLPLIFFLYSLFGAFIPNFSIITLSFTTLKACDYSLFTILKEMLYLPLKTEEKFHAKAVIDVFAYRSAKAIASLAIVLLGSLSLASAVHTISYLLCGIFILWMSVAFFFFKKSAVKA